MEPPIAQPDPPHTGSPEQWGRLIELVDPASLLLIIEGRMGQDLRGRLAPEDILQEALLMAWRDRATHVWRGARVFRNWLLSIIDHRIAEARDHARAIKRGGAVHHRPIGGFDSAGTGQAAPGAEPWLSTTASRIASLKEQALAMQAVLDSLPDDVRSVVRLRLVEQLQIDEIAAQLGIGESTVRHRFRRGAELFRYRLTSRLGSGIGRTTACEPNQLADSPALGGQSSSPG